MIAIGISLFCTVTFAQEPTEISTVISSNPPGAVISLDGEYRINATTPCRLPDNINGLYKVKASMTGYESWSGEIMIIPGQNNRFSVSLASKSRFRSAIRSVFFPGWGQYYSEQNTKAIALNVATLGLALFTYKADSDFRKKRDEFYRAQTELANATSFAEISELRSTVLDKNQDAYQAETTRNMLIGMTVGMYIYNVLDALIFFPDNKLAFQGIIPENIPRVEAGFDGDRFNLTLTASF